ncbi:MAG: ferrochelatase [Planctomycetaceae bacterium]|nr:ferrochelatase [Planctomycetaceae bacterium]
MNDTYDAILIVGFGGPEGPREVIPFLENVLRGRNVPRERLLEVAEHYQHFGGVSPINQQVRDLIKVLEPDLRDHFVYLPIFWGNRNWHPLLGDTVQQMANLGVRRALAIVLSAYSSYSGCRQYQEDIVRAQAAVGDQAPVIDKIRVFYNHPDFIAANAERVQAAMEQVPASDRERVQLAFTAHSIPTSAADRSDYVKQLSESCRLVAEAVGLSCDQWTLVYQSRSGRPQDPWLEPDICDHLRDLNAQDTVAVVIHPIGFLSDHIEVLYDLDTEAAQVAQELGMTMIRSHTVGTHPRFVRMLRKLVQERLDRNFPQEAIGQFGPHHDVCPADCCPAASRPPTPGPPGPGQ